MKIKKTNLLIAILAAVLAPPLSAAAQGMSFDNSFTADMSSFENTVIDSRIAASASDLGSMRDIAMQPFDGSISRNSGGTAVVLDAVREETKRDIYSSAVTGQAREDVKKDVVSTTADKPGLASKVPALVKSGKEDDGNIANVYMAKGLKYIGIAAAATLLVGGAVGGAVLLGLPGALIGLAVGGVVLGVLAAKALRSYWNTF